MKISTTARMRGSTPPRISTPCQPKSWSSAAADSPPSAPPIVKPQNMTMTNRERLRSGQYSEVIVIAAGIAPPRPIPVMKRQIVSPSMVVAVAEAMLATAKAAVAKISTALRPTLSASGPKTKAPAISPNSPAPNKGASCAGVTFHCARSAGAMKPTAAVSNPSAATTRKHRMITMSWYRLSGRELMKSWISTVCVGATTSSWRVEISCSNGLPLFVRPQYVSTWNRPSSRILARTAGHSMPWSRPMPVSACSTPCSSPDKPQM